MLLAVGPRHRMSTCRDTYKTKHAVGRPNTFMEPAKAVMEHGLVSIIIIKAL